MFDNAALLLGTYLKNTITTKTFHLELLIDKSMILLSQLRLGTIDLAICVIDKKYSPPKGIIMVKKFTEELIPVSSTNLAVAFAFAIAKLKSILLVSDKDLTVKTNSSGSPANTFALQAGVPLMWSAADGVVFTDTNNAAVTSVTSLFVTNASGTDIPLLQIRALVDPT